jgi:hypothetical protein
MTPAEDRINSEVRERISGLSDEELLRLLDGAREYTPFALTVARQELSKRGGRKATEDRIAQLCAQAPSPEYAGISASVGEEGGPAYDIYDRDEYASFWRRAAADFLDGLILGIPVALISLLNETVGGLLGLAGFALYHIGLKSVGSAIPSLIIYRNGTFGHTVGLGSGSAIPPISDWPR